MKLIRIKANSIHGALAEARREHGDDVILVESFPADEQSLAEIVIGIDSPSPRKRRIGRGPVGKNSASRLGSTSRAVPYGHHQTVESLRATAFQRQLDSHLTVGRSAGSHEALSLDQDYRRGSGASTVDDSHSMGSTADEISIERNPEPSKRRTFAPRLATAAGKLAERLVGDKSIKSLSGELASRVLNRRGSSNDVDVNQDEQPNTTSPPAKVPDSLESLGIRLQSIERALAGTNLAFANRWIAHPLYSDMTAMGFSPETAINSLSTLASRGVPPNADISFLREKIFEEMRRQNRTVVATTRTGRHVFLGTAGSGKTNLILKAASDPDSLAAGRTIVLTVGDVAGVAATSTFTLAGVETLHVHSAQQLSYSLEVLNRYDTVLIDTTPLTGTDNSRSAQYAALISKLEPLDGVTTHFVIDARRNLTDVAEELRMTSCRVDAIALSNLDGLRRPGLLVDFLQEHNLPVFFASSGRFQPGCGLDRFSPVELLAKALGMQEYPYSDLELNDYFSTGSTRVTRPEMETTKTNLNSNAMRFGSRNSRSDFKSGSFSTSKPIRPPGLGV